MKITPELAELIGLIIGDGHIAYNTDKRIYRLTISGDVKEDKKYFKKISNVIFKITNRRPKIRKRKVIVRGVHKGNSLVLYIDYKKFMEYLINKLELTYGSDKAFKVIIPNKFLNWNYSKYILKGIFESDGSLYFSKSKVIKYPSYPRLEIRTSSRRLAYQIFEILKKRNYRIQIMKTKYNNFKVYLSGEEMLNKWINEIGFSNINTMTKHKLWQKLGYYIPRITAKQRQKVLKSKINPYYYKGSVAQSGKCPRLQSGLSGFKISSL